jgi:hypothetical protein
MDLIKIQEVTSSEVIKINTMEMNKKYPIIREECVSTKFEPTILLHIKETPYKIVKVFIPKPYNSVISDEDMDFIKSQKYLLNFD